MPLERERVLLLDFLFSSQRFQNVFRVPMELLVRRRWLCHDCFQSVQHFNISCSSSSRSFSLPCVYFRLMRLSFIAARETEQRVREKKRALLTSEVCAFFDQGM